MQTRETVLLDHLVAEVATPDEAHRAVRASPEEIWQHYNRPAHCVLGVLLDAVTGEEVMAFIAETARERRHAILATPNVNDLIRAPYSEPWRRALLTSSLSTVDGMPLVLISRILGIPIRKRLAGADLFDALRGGQAGPLKIVFYGGPPGIAAAARREINAEYGALNALGGVDPGFGTVDDLGDSKFIEEVNELDADMLILGLGAKGKPWIDAHAHKIRRGVVTHLGAVLNFAAGSVRRAPTVLRDLGLEWVWRILEEPVLWRRYGSDGLSLLGILATRLLPLWLDGLGGRARAVGRQGRVAYPSIEGGTARIAVAGPLDSGVLGQLRSLFADAAEQRRNIALDLTEATALDTAAAGLLLLAYGMQLRMQRTIAIVGENRAIRRRLRWHGCSDLFQPQHGLSNAVAGSGRSKVIPTGFWSLPSTTTCAVPGPDTAAGQWPLNRPTDRSARPS